MLRLCGDKLALSGFLVYVNYPRVSSPSHLSTHVKGDNELKPGALYINPGIYLTTEEHLEKTQLNDCLMKTVRLFIALQGSLF